MAKIIQLDSHVADLIAAGEVVERPGSVIKELVENSIDSGAVSITVEVTGGGLTYMRVTDNGCGIAPEDTETAFLRHATSKLRDERGLEAIKTLGFRGEALAAIASVSRIELLTCERGAQEGTALLLEGGKVLDKRPAGCPDGTTIIVRDLFFNTPARLKFMKSDRAEAANISTAVLRCALSHPEVSIRYIRDGREEFHTPGDNRPESCIYSLMGRDFFGGLLEARSSDDEVAVRGFVSSPANARGNRANQFFFVNGRYIQSKTLQAALEQAYKNSLFTGRFPSCVLYITMSWGSVDVNVHPSKIEVKFLKEKQVFDGVYYAALSALEGEKSRAAVEISEGTALVLGTKGGEEKHPTIISGTANKDETGSGEPEPSGGEPRQISTDYRESMSRAYADKPSGRLELHDVISAGTQTSFVLPKESFSSNETAGEPEKEQINVESAGEVPEFRLIGEALDTYIVVESGTSLFLIDKHAAHERILFDKFRAQDYEIMSENLITPLVIEPGHEDAALLLENTKMLEEMGFAIDSFGDDAIAVRSVPAMIDVADAEPLLGEICDALRAGKKTTAGELRDEILHTVACKAAIKAGKLSQPEELEVLAARVLSGEVRYCPHGRPIAMEITKHAIDKGFKRLN